MLLTWPADRPVFAVCLLAAVGLYFAAIRVVLAGRLPVRAIWLVLGVAAGLRLLVLAAPPYLSSDVFRYVWDGRVQAAGVNPYLFVPADPALAALRDTAIYPHINRAATAPTIYPPTAQLLFAAVARVGETVLAQKLAMVAFEAVALLCVWRLLAMAGLPPVRLLIYAWNPLAVWEFAGNAHVDAAAIGLLSATLLLRVARRDGWCGVLLGAAILIKFLPAVVAPSLWRRGAGWRTIFTCLATILALYGCYIGAGAKVLGFLAGYRDEEGQADGSGFWLVAAARRLIDLPDLAGQAYLAACAVGLVGLAAWIAFRHRPAPGTPGDTVRVCGDAALMAGSLMLAVSPHYAWYYVWLAVPAVVMPWRWAIWLSAAPAVHYLDLLDPLAWRPALFFVPAILLAVADFRLPARVSKDAEGTS